MKTIWESFFFSSRRRHTRYWRDWSSDVCSSDLRARGDRMSPAEVALEVWILQQVVAGNGCLLRAWRAGRRGRGGGRGDRKSVVLGKSVDLGGRRIIKKK